MVRVGKEVEKWERKKGKEKMKEMIKENKEIIGVI